MTTRNGPAITIVGDCAGCEHVTDDGGVLLCGAKGKPSSVLDRIAFSLRIDMRTPTDCPRLSAARLALLADLARTVCRQCGATVEPERECYAVPTCYACLPPPPRMPVHTIGVIDEAAIRTMMVGDTLSELTATRGEHVKVELGDGGWLVRRGDGDVSLAGTSTLTMRYVKERRGRAPRGEEPAS